MSLSTAIPAPQGPVGTIVLWAGEITTATVRTLRKAGGYPATAGL